MDFPGISLLLMTGDFFGIDLESRLYRFVLYEIVPLDWTIEKEKILVISLGNSLGKFVR